MKWGLQHHFSCLFQITELCGAKRVGYFGPTQFYIALKLIAAAQSGLPVRTESIKCELPLPRFGMSKSDGEMRFGNPAELHGKKVQIPYTLMEKNSLKRMDNEDKQSFSVERELQDNNSNYPDEPWRITEEQREYYVNQFRSLQPDPSSFISGSVAKNFFTKSKLSIPELSYIWELSDADCDGALTLPEFCAAFHLIVARKNGYPLPEGLPPTLQSEYLQAAFPKSKWECAIFDSYSESMPANQPPCDLNRMEKSSIKDMADFPVPTQDVTTGDDKQALKSTVNEPLPKDVAEDTVIQINFCAFFLSFPSPPLIFLLLLLFCFVFKAEFFCSALEPIPELPIWKPLPPKNQCCEIGNQDGKSIMTSKSAVPHAVPLLVTTSRFFYNAVVSHLYLFFFREMALFTQLTTCKERLAILGVCFVHCWHL
ncbi:Reps2 [Phodopus roborovskii]|uniref:Reps2 protein n=1 Tax=Phodopus roborovskii TaxID=109678 RepID=A0AAU9YXK1_PHORO|nr:Reps2 [Phodopus roborovskii]